jgi:peptidylprolyl isomerase
MKFKRTLFIMSALSLSLWAKSTPKKNVEAPQAEVQKEDALDVKKLSIAFGHLIAKNINEIGVPFDLEAIIQGLQEASKGVASPLTENDVVSAITKEQKKTFDALAAKNLNEAESFLAQEAKKTDITSLDEGKVLYKVLQEGTGPEVQEQGKIAILYKGTLLNGDVFGESQKAEPVELNQLVVGLKQALIGMKEGEKRLIHIHPEKAYGTEGMLPPNSLLSFEIEIASSKVEEAPLAKDEPEQALLEQESDIR